MARNSPSDEIRIVISYGQTAILSPAYRRFSNGCL